MEYCLTTPQHPLIIFLPTELTMNEYKNFMTVALSSIDQYKRQGIENQRDALELQQKLERIIFNYSLPLLELSDLEEAIPDHLRQKAALNISKINFCGKPKEVKRQKALDLQDDDIQFLDCERGTTNLSNVEKNTQNRQSITDLTDDLADEITFLEERSSCG